MSISICFYILFFGFGCFLCVCCFWCGFSAWGWVGEGGVWGVEGQGCKKAAVESPWTQWRHWWRILLSDQATSPFFLQSVSLPAETGADGAGWLQWTTTAWKGSNPTRSFSSFKARRLKRKNATLRSLIEFLWEPCSQSLEKLGMSDDGKRGTWQRSSKCRITVNFVLESKKEKWIQLPPKPPCKF